MWKGVAPRSSPVMPADCRQNRNVAAQQQEDKLNREKLIQETIESVQSGKFKSYGAAMKQTGVCAYNLI